MPEKKEETTAINGESNHKKTNLLNHNSIKHILDEYITQIVTSKGNIEDVRLINVRLWIGSVIIIIALFAQFYYKYVVFNVILQLIIYTKENNAILFTYPPLGSFNTTGLVVSSKMPRFSDMYTLDIASADPQSISARPPVEFTKSVTQWFTKDGVLVESLFWKDVEGLINMTMLRKPRRVSECKHKIDFDISLRERSNLRDWLMIDDIDLIML